MHYRVRYSLDFDPKIRSGQVCKGADYSFDIKSGFSIAPAFSLHNNFYIACVLWPKFNTLKGEQLYFVNLIGDRSSTFGHVFLKIKFFKK